MKQEGVKSRAALDGAGAFQGPHGDELKRGKKGRGNQERTDRP